MSFVCFSPLAQGLLLGKYDPAKPPVFEPGDHRLNSKAFSAEHLSKLQPKIDKLKGRFGNTIEDLASVALNYCLAMPHVACVIPGFRNQTQAACNLAADGRSLSADDVAFVQQTLKM
jgi:aryl-alcohol dehydrogenase-like predicted oxidoreductase